MYDSKWNYMVSSPVTEIQLWNLKIPHTNATLKGEKANQNFNYLILIEVSNYNMLILKYVMPIIMYTSTSIVPDGEWKVISYNIITTVSVWIISIPSCQ